MLPRVDAALRESLLAPEEHLLVGSAVWAVVSEVIDEGLEPSRRLVEERLPAELQVREAQVGAAWRDAVETLGLMQPQS